MIKTFLASAMLALPALPVVAQELPQLRVTIPQDADSLDPAVVVLDRPAVRCFLRTPYAIPVFVQFARRAVFHGPVIPVPQ